MNAMTEIDLAVIEKTLAGIQIPPEHTILSAIRMEQTKPDPNMSNITKLVIQDVALSAAILKTINSPFYGLRRKVEAIHNAVVMLGGQNITTLVTAISLKSIDIQCNGLSLERFWQSATDVANICLLLAKKFYFNDCDKFYALGLFHDVGIPLLAQKYEDYKQVLMEGNNAIDRSITAIEEDHYNTNHATVGFYLCKSWHLAESITEVVLEHHEFETLIKDGEAFETRNQLMAVLKMASNVSHTFRRANEDNEWSSIDTCILDFLGLSDDEYTELKSDIHEMLG